MLRTPLATISGNRARGKELSPYYRGFLVGQAAQGQSLYRIAKTQNLYKSTVRNVVLNTQQ